MTTAYIIRNNKFIATIDTDLKNGAEVAYAFNRCEEKINANREWNLVNAKYGKVSRAKKWQKEAALSNETGISISPDEFYIL